jgi:hypothetical protein
VKYLCDLPCARLECTLGLALIASVGWAIVILAEVVGDSDLLQRMESRVFFRVDMNFLLSLLVLELSTSPFEWSDYPNRWKDPELLGTAL